MEQMFPKPSLTKGALKDIKKMFTNKYTRGSKIITKPLKFGNSSIYIKKSYYPWFSEILIPVGITTWKWNRGPLWNEYGRIHYNLRVFHYFIEIRINVGLRADVMCYY